MTKKICEEIWDTVGALCIVGDLLKDIDIKTQEGPFVINKTEVRAIQHLYDHFGEDE
jgi:hypothetical protein